MYGEINLSAELKIAEDPNPALGLAGGLRVRVRVRLGLRVLVRVGLTERVRLKQDGGKRGHFAVWRRLYARGRKLDYGRPQK
jgi:hypothetical protein